MCPKNWILINSKCLLVNRNPDTYVNNLQLCKKHGAFILHDLNLNEIEHLSKFLDDKSAWIGHLTNFNSTNQSNKFENNCIYLNKKEGILFNERCSNEHIQLCYKQSIMDIESEDNSSINPLEQFFHPNQQMRRAFSIRKKLFRFRKKNRISHLRIDKLELIKQSMGKIETELSALKKQLKQIAKEK